MFILWSQGVLSSGISRLGVDYSSESTTEIKNEWSCTSTPPHISMAWTGRNFITSLSLCLHNLSGFIVIHFTKLPLRLKFNFTKIPRGHFLGAFSNINLCINFLVINVASHPNFPSPIPPFHIYPFFIQQSAN